MAKLTFVPDQLKRAFALARLVKPASGDYIIKVISGTLVIHSADRRRFCRSEVKPSSTTAGDENYTSEDFYLPADRQSLFDSDLDSVSLSFTDKGMQIKAEGSGQTRQATLKKRADNSRRATCPPRPTVSGTSVKASDFQDLLHHVACSALVRETKTEEDMRVNQVHFYPDAECAVSNARFYASVSTLDGLALDLSVVSSDVPLIKNFCSKFAGDIIVGQDKNHLFIADPVSHTCMFFSRVACNKPPLTLLKDEGYKIDILVDRAQMAKALQWSVMAVDGTSRLSLAASGSEMSMSSKGQELARVPVSFELGSDFKADFPVKILNNILTYTTTEKVLLRFGHKDAPSILQITEYDSESKARGRHYVQSMEDRK